MANSIWITWEKQVRNRSMAAAVGAQLFEFIYEGNRLCRYLKCGIQTFRLVWVTRPGVVYAQNPSFVLTLVLILSKNFLPFKLVSDAHFGGVVAYSGNRVMQVLLDYCNRKVDLVIVTNETHAAYITGIGGRAVICEDPLPVIKSDVKGIARKQVLYICTYAVDEPFDVAFQAAELLVSDGFIFCVSGNYRKAKIDPTDYPSVNFLGFLPENEYYSILGSSEIVLDLTNSEDILLCGAYEAMAADKPLVTSNTSCLSTYFSKGTLFTEHTPDRIAETIKSAYECREELVSQIKQWKKAVYRLQEKRVSDIRRALEV